MTGAQQCYVCGAEFTMKSEVRFIAYQDGAYRHAHEFHFEKRQGPERSEYVPGPNFPDATIEPLAQPFSPTALDYFAANCGGFPEDAEPESAALRLGIAAPDSGTGPAEMSLWWARADAIARYMRAAAMLAEKAKRDGEAKPQTIERKHAVLCDACGEQLAVLDHRAEWDEDRSLIVPVARQFIESHKAVCPKRGGSSPAGDASIDETLAKIRRAEAHVDALCNGSEKWTMRVPANPERDSDLLISDALQAAREFVLADLARRADAVEVVKLRDQVLEEFAGWCSEEAGRAAAESDRFKDAEEGSADHLKACELEGRSTAYRDIAIAARSMKSGSLARVASSIDSTLSGDVNGAEGGAT